MYDDISLRLIFKNIFKNVLCHLIVQLLLILWKWYQIMALITEMLLQTFVKSPWIKAERGKFIHILIAWFKSTMVV